MGSFHSILCWLPDLCHHPWSARKQADSSGLLGLKAPSPTSGLGSFPSVPSPNTWTQSLSAWAAEVAHLLPPLDWKETFHRVRRALVSQAEIRTKKRVGSCCCRSCSCRWTAVPIISTPPLPHNWWDSSTELEKSDMEPIPMLSEGPQQSGFSGAFQKCAAIVSESPAQLSYKSLCLSILETADTRVFTPEPLLHYFLWSRQAVSLWHLIFLIKLWRKLCILFPEKKIPVKFCMHLGKVHAFLLPLLHPQVPKSPLSHLGSLAVHNHFPEICFLFFWHGG